MTDADELDAWLRLVHRPGLGRDAMRRLLASLGSAQAVAGASRAALQRLVDPKMADEMAVPPDGHADRLTATREWLAGAPCRQLLTLGDPDYPAALLETGDPPLALYLQGRAELLQAPSIAIVGSRNPTAQGLDNARALAAHFSQAGWTVVSGLAAGIDGAAHEGALDGAGSTVAVVGTGLDRVYPSRHRPLAHRIAEQGLMVSEFPLGTPPLQQHFPQRNRIIAGLTRGTLVVEAALQSGSLITARMASDAGREVFAVPGSIHSPQSRGCHALLREGAKLVETAADVLEELGAQAPLARPAATPLSSAAGPADPVLAVLGHDPATLDALIARCGWPADRLNAHLLELELAGQVARLPGGLFQRRQSA